MNYLAKRKFIPLASILSLTLAMTPGITMADDGGRQKNQYSHDGAKSHKKQPRKEQHVIHGYNKPAHNKARHKQVTKVYGKPYMKHNKPVHYKYVSYGHDYRGHDHRGYGHTRYIVIDDHHHEHYVDLDDIRFKVGLHTGNLDIIFHD